MCFVFIFYISRHTWATIASNEAGVDKYTVHTALNHVDENMRVTDIYIAKSWDSIDAANRKVLDYVKLSLDDVTEKKYIPKNKRVLPKQNLQMIEIQCVISVILPKQKYSLFSFA